jgi:hypothetical protein
MTLEANFQGFVSMNRNCDPYFASNFGIDMTTSGDSLQRLTTQLQQASKALA